MGQWKGIRWLGPLFVCACLVSLAAAPGGDDRGARIVASVAMMVWLDVMPTFPAPDDRVHALLDVELANRSQDPVRVELDSVTVRRADSRETLLVFAVEPPAGWDGVLEPGESFQGVWTKTELRLANPFECDANVVGIIEIAIHPARGERGERAKGTVTVRRVATEPTVLSCVF